MYEVTQDYLDKATAAGRVYSLRVDVGEVVDGAVVDKAQYLGGVGVLSLKIVRGQTTGGFSLGGTVCAQLSATFTNDVDVRVKDRLQVYVRFGSGDGATAWRGLGWFYVDSVKQGLYSKSVTAYDAMLRLGKNYKSKLTYPAKTSDVLNEISDQTGINLSSSLSLINDATIETTPQMDKSKDGEQRYYTRRAILGYIAATNAGEAYIDVDFKINLATPTETGHTIEAASVISQTVDDTGFMVDGIVWNKSGISYSLNDDFTENTVELTNPLEYASEEQVLHNLETKLVGLSYSSITLKKQGTGIFQLGDLVNYAALDGTVYTMLVMGIVYDFSNGFFSETLYSLAKSASQQEYTGSQVTDQKEYTSSETVIGGTLTEYEYLTDLSAKCNGVTYTVEKDDTTGLVSKISDSNGNEFKPTINSGITDTALHNAVFWAVAMTMGFGGSSAPKPVIELLFNNSLENTGSGSYTIAPTTNSAEILYSDGLNGKCYSATNKSGITITDVSELLLSDFTITFWTKINDNGLSPYPQYRRFVWWTSNNAYRGCELKDASTYSTNIPGFVLTGGVNAGTASTPIADGEWHSVSIVQRGSTITTTIDQVEQIVWNNCILSPVRNYLALSHKDYTLNGYISSFRVFNKALNYAEIERVLALK